MKKIIILVSLLMITLVSVPKALAYFYTYTSAQGTLRVSITDESSFEETVVDKTKTLSIKADNDSDPIFVRAKIIKTSDVETNIDLGTGWSGPRDDDFYYYDLPLDGKEGMFDQTATDIVVTIKFPASAEDGDKYNVVVLYEATPAIFSSTMPSATQLGDNYSLYEETDNYWYTDWKEVLVND